MNGRVSGRALAGHGEAVYVCNARAALTGWSWRTHTVSLHDPHMVATKIILRMDKGSFGFISVHLDLFRCGILVREMDVGEMTVKFRVFPPGTRGHLTP